MFIERIKLPLAVEGIFSEALVGLKENGWLLLCCEYHETVEPGGGCGSPQKRQWTSYAEQ
jgi:hypothetical protein